MKICLDYGHCLSGADTGAEGCGQKEEILTREVGRKVRQILQQHNINVIETVYNNTFNNVEDSLKYRWSVANKEKVDLFVSIHFNCSNGKGHGTEIYTNLAKHFKEADQVLKNIVELGFTDRGIKDGRNLAVIRNTEMTSMLIECCFIDNRSDMNLFNSNKMAEAIAYAFISDSEGNSEKIKKESLSQDDHSKAMIAALYSVTCSLNDFVSKHPENKSILYDIKAIQDVMKNIENK